MNYYKISNKEIATLNNLSFENNYRNTDIPNLVNFNKIISLDDYIKRKMVKFVDNDGSVQVLNFDCTLTLAQLFSNTDIPMSLSKKSSYLSRTTSMTTRRLLKETLIWGAENYNENELESDSDILSLGISSLKILGITDFTLDIGSIEFIDAMVSTIKEKNKSEIIRLIEEKNTSELERYLALTSLDESTKTKILQIPTIFGDFRTSIKKARKISINTASDIALDKLEALFSNLSARGYGDYLMLDIGFTNSYDYYSGIIFKGYTNDFGKVVLQGGRYDSLMRVFNSNLKGCGFSVDLDKIVEVKENDKSWRQQRKSC